MKVGLSHGPEGEPTERGLLKRISAGSLWVCNWKWAVKHLQVGLLSGGWLSNSLGSSVTVLKMLLFHNRK